MRLKPTYNFLGSGCLFCYRDIFSGLSNETVGAASYSFPPMDPSIHQLVYAINAYQQLLIRYARRIVHNNLVADLITEEVFSKYSSEIKVIPPKDIRKFLHHSTKACCQEWLNAKKGTLFQRYPKNPT